MRHFLLAAISKMMLKSTSSIEGLLLFESACNGAGKQQKEWFVGGESE